MEDSTGYLGDFFQCLSILIVKIVSISPEKTFLVATCNHCPFAFLCESHLLISSLSYLKIYICIYIYMFVDIYWIIYKINMYKNYIYTYNLFCLKYSYVLFLLCFSSVSLLPMHQMEKIFKIFLKSYILETNPMILKRLLCFPAVSVGCRRKGSKDDCVPVNTELLPQWAMIIKSGSQNEKSDMIETFLLKCQNLWIIFL